MTPSGDANFGAIVVSDLTTNAYRKLINEWAQVPRRSQAGGVRDRKHLGADSEIRQN
jgi:hypothetical protein